MVFEQIESALHPRSIAIAGASDNPLSMGYHFLHYLIDYGYPGDIYPINHNRRLISGLRTYPTLREVPGPIDYVICCLPASRVLDFLEDCPQKKVKTIQLFTARLSETGDKDAILLENQILKKAIEFGIRLIGPNCMGIYHPKMGIYFGYDLPEESGPVGMFFQSGGVSAGFIRYASLQGVRFSKVISFGNGLDFNESDYLEYFTQDPETKVIASYIEGTKDGRRFLKTLRQATPLKPVIVLKSGRSKAGIRTASSHTAALAGSQNIWESGMRQAGAIQARTLEEMIDLVVSFYFLPPIFGRNVGIVGGSGGRGVISADEWEEAGFRVIPLPPEIRKLVKEVSPELWWKWIENPIDMSMLPDYALKGNFLKLMMENPSFDFIVANLDTDAPLGKDEMINHFKGDIDDIVEIKNKSKKPLIAVLSTGSLGIDDFKSWRWRLIAEQKTRLVDNRIPVYPSLSQAASALNHLVEYYQRKETR